MIKHRHISLLIAFFVTISVWHPSTVLDTLSIIPQALAQATPTPTPTPKPDDDLTEEEKDELSEKQSKVEELRQKLKEIEGQKISLSSTIQYINTKISLQQAEIDKTQSELNTLEKQLKDLSTRISGLEQSLDVLSDTLITRVNDTYKQSQTNPVHLLLISNGMSDFFTKYRYMQIAQAHTREVMEQAESQKMNFDIQKQLKEEKQEEVEQKRTQLQSQKNQLTAERAGQQKLLEATRNDEAKYMEELARAQAEYDAIQGIIAGKGQEVKVGRISKGERIASIISGRSPCSRGTHLHFEVVLGGTRRDPASYLKSISPVWNNSPDGAFSFNGDWEWPLNDPAKINQGYGMTWYARPGGYSRNGAYGGAPHTGIDIASKTPNDLTVKAVENGELYRGIYKGICNLVNGSRDLKYVRVIHDDGASTYYLHVNY